jgi:hypothetical protein
MRVRPDGAPGLIIRPRPELQIVSLGWQVVDWAEAMLCHGPGDLAEDALELDDELVAFIVGAYAIDPATGARLVREAVLSRAKGRAKSELAAIIVCAEALGPVRFDHWAKAGERSWWGYEYEEGEPVGRRVKSPFVRVLATEEGQTGNTYDNVHLMLTKGAIATTMPDIDVGLTRTLIPGGGKIEPCTAGAASKDGGKETFAVADEIHLYILPGLRSMYRTVSRNLTKRRGYLVQSGRAVNRRVESEGGGQHRRRSRQEPRPLLRPPPRHPARRPHRRQGSHQGPQGRRRRRREVDGSRSPPG